MTRRTPGIADLVVTVTAAFIVLGGIVVLEALYYGLADAGGTTAGGRVRGALVAALLALGVIAIGVAVVAGGALRRAFGQLRAAVLARARGDVQAALPVFSVREFNELSSAVDRLSARDAVREADARREGAEVAAMLDTISEGILRLDADGRVLRANPAARELLGLGDAGIGQLVATRVRHAELRRALIDAARGTGAAATEITLDDRRLLLSARPLAAAADGGGGAVVAFVDLTEVRRLESVRRDFVANVSHELKTPLTSIRGYAETLLAGDELTPELRREFTQTIARNAERLHRIVEDLLDLSRLESGGWRPQLDTVETLPLILDVCAGCGPRALACGVRVVPPGDGLAVRADAGGLRQALTNLLDNALRHTPRGGCIEITTHGAPGVGSAPGRVVFEVRDTGTGIPSDALPRIFERFYRVDPARSRADGGTGLGLSIVKHLIESMGGDVTAESELGHGTTIRFRLPQEI
jgi:two-component system, OmpR family, phosphate regulon sensor histidine kinase PhoR